MARFLCLLAYPEKDGAKLHAWDPRQERILCGAKVAEVSPAPFSGARGRACRACCRILDARVRAAKTKNS